MHKISDTPGERSMYMHMYTVDSSSTGLVSRQKWENTNVEVAEHPLVDMLCNMFEGCFSHFFFSF